MKQKVGYIKAIPFPALHDGSCSFYWVHQPNGYLFMYLSIIYRTLPGGRHFDRYGFPPTLSLLEKKKEQGNTAPILATVWVQFPLLFHPSWCNSCILGWLIISQTRLLFPSFQSAEIRDLIISLLQNSRYYEIFYSSYVKHNIPQPGHLWCSLLWCSFQT